MNLAPSFYLKKLNYELLKIIESRKPMLEYHCDGRSLSRTRNAYSQNLDELTRNTSLVNDENDFKLCLIQKDKCQLISKNTIDQKFLFHLNTPHILTVI